METGARLSLRGERCCSSVQQHGFKRLLFFFLPLEKEKSQWMTAGTLGGMGFI